MQARAEQDPRQRDRVFPIRVGDGDVEGIPFNAIVPDVRGRTPEQVAELIENRLRLVMGGQALEPTSLSSKLADSQDRAPEQREISVVEDERAGNSARQRRSRQLQAQGSVTQRRDSSRTPPLARSQTLRIGMVAAVIALLAPRRKRLRQAARLDSGGAAIVGCRRSHDGAAAGSCVVPAIMRST